MLKPLITGFLNFHFIDYLLFNAAFAAGAFFFDWRLPGPDVAGVHVMTRRDIWVYWVQWVAGALAALLLRLWVRRGVRVRLLPSDNEAGGIAYQGVLVALAAYLSMFLYLMRIDDPADALIEPFAIGIVVSAVALCCVMLAAELVEYFLGTLEAPVLLTWRTSRNLQAALCALAAMALDLLAFEHGHFFVLLTLAGLLALWLLAAMIGAVPYALG
jgi:hypothetical protein